MSDKSHSNDHLYIVILAMIYKFISQYFLRTYSKQLRRDPIRLYRGVILAP